MYLSKRGKDEGKPSRCMEHWVVRSDCDGLEQETLEMLTETGPLSCWLLSRSGVRDAFLSVKCSQLKLSSTKHNYGLWALLRKPLLWGQVSGSQTWRAVKVLWRPSQKKKGLTQTLREDWAYRTQVPNEKIQTGKDILRQLSRCLDTIHPMCKVTLRLRFR